VRKKSLFHHYNGDLLHRCFLLVSCFSTSFRFLLYAPVLILCFVLLLRFVLTFMPDTTAEPMFPGAVGSLTGVTSLSRMLHVSVAAGDLADQVPTASVLLHTNAFPGKNRLWLLILGLVSSHLPLVLFQVQIWCAPHPMFDLGLSPTANPI
jgi:hypothetical protein